MFYFKLLALVGRRGERRGGFLLNGAKQLVLIYRIVRASPWLQLRISTSVWLRFFIRHRHVNLQHRRRKPTPLPARDGGHPARAESTAVFVAKESPMWWTSVLQPIDEIPGRSPSSGWRILTLRPGRILQDVCVDEDTRVHLFMNSQDL